MYVNVNYIDQSIRETCVCGSYVNQRGRKNRTGFPCISAPFWPKIPSFQYSHYIIFLEIYQHSVYNEILRKTYILRNNGYL